MKLPTCSWRYFTCPHNFLRFRYISTISCNDIRITRNTVGLVNPVEVSLSFLPLIRCKVHLRCYHLYMKVCNNQSGLKSKIAPCEVYNKSRIFHLRQ